MNILCISKIKKESIYIIDSKMKRSMDIIAKKSSIYEKVLPDPSISPVIIIFKWISEAVPLSKSIIHKLESRSVADMGKIFSHYNIFICYEFFKLRIQCTRNINVYLLVYVFI